DYSRIFWPASPPGNGKTLKRRDHMKSVKIDCSRIDSWNSFHWVFDEALGFPDYYGMNVNAWIECLTDLDDPDSGLTSIHVEKGQVLVLELLNVSPSSETMQSCTPLLSSCPPSSTIVGLRPARSLFWRFHSINQRSLLCRP